MPGAHLFEKVVAFKSPGEPRYLAQAITVLTLAARRPPPRYPVVVARYIAPEGQRLCREAGVGDHLDPAGNAFLRLVAPPYRRVGDAGRTLIQSAPAGPADLVATDAGK